MNVQKCVHVCAHVSVCVCTFVCVMIGGWGVAARGHHTPGQAPSFLCMT